MAATKGTAVLTASGTLTAGTPITSSAVNISAQDYATVTAVITNGGTGPTLPAIVTIQTSFDNTTFRSVMSQTANTVASAVNTFTFAIDPAVQYVKTNFAGNTAQNCTVASEIGYGTW
jgi:hypothetical protein